MTRASSCCRAGGGEQVRLDSQCSHGTICISQVFEWFGTCCSRSIRTAMRTLTLIIAVALLSSTALAQQPLAPGGGPGGIRQGNQGQGIGWGPPVRPNSPPGLSPGPVGPPPVGSPATAALPSVGSPLPAGPPPGGGLRPVGSPPGSTPSPTLGPAPSPSSIVGLAADTATAPGPMAAVPPMGGIGGGSSPAVGGSGTISAAGAGSPTCRG
jgi:hypothetical protein